MGITSKVLVIPIVLGAGIATASIAFASNREDIRLLGEAKITLGQAIDAAEKHQGGKAVEAGLDKDNSQLSYEVDVVKGNQVYDVKVDAISGKVISSHEDRDDDDDDD